MPKLQRAINRNKRDGQEVVRTYYRLNIPPTFVHAKNWEVGQEINFEIDKRGKLVLSASNE